MGWADFFWRLYGVGAGWVLWRRADRRDLGRALQYSFWGILGVFLAAAWLGLSAVFLLLVLLALGRFL